MDHDHRESSQQGFQHVRKTGFCGHFFGVLNGSSSGAELLFIVPVPSGERTVCAAELRTLIIEDEVKLENGQGLVILYDLFARFRWRLSSAMECCYYKLNSYTISMLKLYIVKDRSRFWPLFF